MGLLDFLPPGSVDVNNPPATIMSPQMLGLLGAAAGAGQYAGASRLPVGIGPVIGGAAGGYARGYTQGLANIGQAQNNQLLGARTDLYRSLIPALQGLMGGPQSGAPTTQPIQQAQAQPVSMNTPMGPATLTGENQGNINSFMSDQGYGTPAPSPAPSGASPMGAVQNAQRMAMIGGLLGMNGIGDAAKIGLQYNPQVNAAVEAAKSQVSSPLAVDLANEKAARAVNDIPTADAWHLKAMQDMGALQVARNSGIVTTLNPDGSVKSYVNPEQGSLYSNGALSLIPGAVSSLAQKSFAQSGGESAGKLLNEPVETVEPKGPNAGRETTKLGGQLFPITVPGIGTIGGGSASGGTRGGSSSTATPPVSGVVTKLAPSSAEMSKAAGEQAGKNNEAYQQEAELAKDQNAQIAAIRSSAATFGTGKFANVRGEFLNFLNSAPGGSTFAEAAFGKDWQQQLGSYQEGTKIGIQLQAAATRVLGAREAAQIFTWMGKSMPNLTMSQDGLQKVSGFMQGMNDYKIARAQAAQTRFNQNDAVGVNNVRNEFIQKSDPTFFIMADMSPTDRAEFAKNMGPKWKSFAQKWSDAVRAGYAPEPQ